MYEVEEASRRLRNRKKIGREINRRLHTRSGRLRINRNSGRMLGERHNLFPMHEYDYYRIIVNEYMGRLSWFIGEYDGRKIGSDLLMKQKDPKFLNINKRLHNKGFQS